MPRQYAQLDVNNKLIWNFRDIGHTLRRISEGKGGQKRILIILLQDGPLTQKELTQRLGIQPGSASEVLSKLEQAGLIVRAPNEADRRTTDIRLTERGKIQAELARVQREQRHEQMFVCLSAEEKEQLVTVLEKLNVDWSQRYQQSETEQENFRKGHGHFHHA